MLPDLSRLSLTDASIQNRSAPDGLSKEFKSIALDSKLRTAEGAIIYKFGEGEPIAAHVSQRVGIAKSGDRGLGLFAIENMKEGDFVCMFTGAWALGSDFAAALGEWERVTNTKTSIRNKLLWSLKSSDICVDAYSASSMTVVPYNDARINDGKQGTKETFSCAGQTAFHELLCVPRMVTEYREQRSGTGETLCSVQFSTVKLPSGVARPLDVGALMSSMDLPDCQPMASVATCAMGDCGQEDIDRVQFCMIADVLRNSCQEDFDAGVTYGRGSVPIVDL